MARISRNMTQKGLTGLADVSQGHISQVERGDKPPTYTFLRQTADALKIPIVLFMLEDSGLEGEHEDLLQQLTALRGRYILEPQQ